MIGPKWERGAAPRAVCAARRAVGSIALGSTLALLAGCGDPASDTTSNPSASRTTRTTTNAPSRLDADFCEGAAKLDELLDDYKRADRDATTRAEDADSHWTVVQSRQEAERAKIAPGSVENTRAMERMQALNRILDRDLPLRVVTDSITAYMTAYDQQVELYTNPAAAGAAPLDPAVSLERLTQLNALVAVERKQINDAIEAFDDPRPDAELRTVSIEFDALADSFVAAAPRSLRSGVTQLAADIDDLTVKLLAVQFDPTKLPQAALRIEAGAADENRITAVRRAAMDGCG